MSIPRPTLHHAPSSGWSNDPLALTFHDGRYHLFFQYVAGRTTWDVACAWGHATSDDLLAWRTEPVAVAPGDGEDGVWSGSLTVGPDGPVVFYTAVDADDSDHGRVRRAVPHDDDWSTWRKEDVVVRSPDGPDVAAFRDPFVHRYGEGWRMLLAGGLESGEGALWVSTSADLRSWSTPVVAASGATMGALWECPALVEVDGRTMLVLSVGTSGLPHAVMYAFCDDRGDRLDLGAWQRLTYGPSPYAASAFTDADDRPGLIAWLRGVGDAGAGWMGAHSLPWSLHVAGDHLVAAPPAVLERRRSGEVMDGLLPSVADIEWAARPGDFLVGREAFRLDAAGDSVVVTFDDTRHEMPWDEGPLRVVLDGPVLEVFGGRGVLAAPVPATGRDGVLTGSTDRVRVHRLSG